MGYFSDYFLFQLLNFYRVFGRVFAVHRPGALANMAAAPGTRAAARKQNTVTIVDDHFTPSDVINAVHHTCGEKTILSCININGIWQLTLNSELNTKILLEQKITVNNTEREVQGVSRNFLTVSLFNVPAYIHDQIVIGKLESFGCIIRSQLIRKRYREAPSIENGSRFVRVDLPDTVKSLPFAIELEDNGLYVRLLHNNQIKICNNCLSDSHIPISAQHTPAKYA